MRILVLNPGSSTLKFSVHRSDGNSIAREESSIIDRVRDMGAAAEEAIRSISGTIDAVGCRVVHGGSDLVEPVRVDASVLETIQRLAMLAPLHNPLAALAIEASRRLLPDVPVIAVFDTSFHRTIPPVAATYAISHDVAARYGLRRFGFHGISHQYVTSRLIDRLGRLDVRLIICHLGNGSSMSAIRNGECVDTSMGLTPMEGLVMGTRSGDIDPGLMLLLLRNGFSVDDLDDLLNHRSGLLGVSGRGGDLRDLEAAGDERSELAMSVYAYRVTKYIGGYAAALGGLDALAFTAGIGEHSASMRARICRPLAFLGVELDEEKNREERDDERRIDRGTTQVWVIPTDEEREIARAVQSVLGRPIAATRS